MACTATASHPLDVPLPLASRLEPLALNPSRASVGLVWSGCGGGSFVTHVAKQLLAAHGVRVCNEVDGKHMLNELAKGSKNPWYNKSVGWSGAFRNMNAAMREAGAWSVIKLEPSGLRPDVAPVLLELGTLMVNGWRENALDELVCNVRDCFANMPSAWPVDGATGQRSTLCFARRSQPSNATRSYKAYFSDMDDMVKRLRLMKQQHRLQAYRLRRWGWHSFANVTYEELSAFQHDQALLNLSVRSWGHVLASWMIHPNEAAINEVLAPDAGTRLPRAPHSETIYNAKTVRSALSRSDPGMLGLFRD